jgi:hypothetical protein
MSHKIKGQPKFDDKINVFFGEPAVADQIGSGGVYLTIIVSVKKVE